ncbi:MAG: hypothetical protein ABSG70_14105 [Terriglobales bacterium]|jgi:hypothetical protein
MSQQRQQRRKEEAKAEAEPVNWRKRIIYGALILAAFAFAYYLGNRSQHKYDSFARCLGDRGVKMYGAWWCPHCQEQKEKFAASFEYAPYVECGIKGDVHGLAQVCKEQDIHHFPTWQFPPTGERVERIFTLEELRDRTGCSLP